MKSENGSAIILSKKIVLSHSLEVCGLNNKITDMLKKMIVCYILVAIYIFFNQIYRRFCGFIKILSVDDTISCLFALQESSVSIPEETIMDALRVLIGKAKLLISFHLFALIWYYIVYLL